MDKHTKEKLWQCWSNSNYVEKHYPKVAEAFRKSKEGDFSEFIQKKYPELIKELSSHYSSDNLKGCSIGNTPFIFKPGDWVTDGYGPIVEILSVGNNSIKDSYFSRIKKTKKLKKSAIENNPSEFHSVAPKKFDKSKFELPGRKIVSYWWDRRDYYREMVIEYEGENGKTEVFGAHEVKNLQKQSKEKKKKSTSLKGHDNPADYFNPKAKVGYRAPVCPESVIIELVAKDLNIPKATIKETIDTYWSFIFGKIADGKKVQLQKVGSFYKDLHEFHDNLHGGKLKKKFIVKFDKSTNLNKECGMGIEL